MVGRIPVMDVMPARRPAGDSPRRRPSASLPGHRDGVPRGPRQLGAEVVLTGPDGVRRPPVRMAKDADEPDRYERLGDARRRGRVDVRGAGVVRPARHLAARRRAQDPRRRRRRADVHRGRGCCSSGSLAGLDPTRRRRPTSCVQRRDRRRRGHRRARSRPGWPRCRTAEVRAVLAAHPLRDLVTVEGPFPAYADRPRALYGSWYEFFPRSEGATTDAETGKVTSGTFTTAAKRLDAVAAMGFDVDLPAADPPDRRGQPQGPQQHARRPAPTTRLAVGDRRQGRRPRRDPPRPRHVRRLRRLRRAGRRARPRGRARPRPAVRARPPVGRRAPGVVHHPRRRHHRVRREPAEEVPGHLPAQLRQRPRRASAAEVLRVVRHWMDHGVRIFRVDNPHTKPVAFWEWLLARGPRDRPRRALPVRGVHPAGDDARARRDRLPPVLHLLHLAQRQAARSRTTCASCPTRPTT